MGKASVRFEVIQEVLSQHENELSVSLLCEIAGVSRSGYYSWLKAEGARQAREEKDRADFALALEAYRFRGYQKGARSIYMRLLYSDPPVQMNVKKIWRLMDKYGLFCPIRKANPYRRIAKALKTDTVAGNLLNRGSEAHGARKILLTDITYIPYHGTSCYLSTILDAFTEQVLAYRVIESLEIDFGLETVRSLVREHGISLSAETLIHSDQGCHYTSCQFIQIVRDAQLRQSMSRKGNCWDNAPQESFFGHMKDEVDLSGIRDFPDAKAVIDDWMDYYNNDRYQWQLARLSPNEYYTYIMTGEYPLKLIEEPASGQSSDNG